MSSEIKLERKSQNVKIDNENNDYDDMYYAMKHEDIKIKNFFKLHKINRMAILFGICINVLLCLAVTMYTMNTLSDIFIKYLESSVPLNIPEDTKI